MSRVHYTPTTPAMESLPSTREEEEEEEEPISRSQSPKSTTSSSRPDNLRSSTEPTPSVLLQGWLKEKETNDWSLRPKSAHRNRSPYSRSHLRSRSTGTSLSAPLMTRAHSMPNPHMPRSLEQMSPSSGSSLSPSPNMRSPARAKSPSKVQLEDAMYNPPPRSPSWFESPSASAGGGSGIEAIQEDSELDITPKAQLHHPLPAPAAAASFSRSNSLRSLSGGRRPASPAPPTSFPASVIDQNAQLHTTTSSGSNSPALGPQKYNEAFPAPFALLHYASSSSFSSIPSTPTSARSRSPSISSLDTIEDAPEEESEAVERERIERLRLAAERAESGEGSDSDEGPRRRSLDAPRGFGFKRGGGGEKKRWSICGGERRGDLDLETIWED